MKTILIAIFLTMSLYACSSDASKTTFESPVEKPNGGMPETPSADKMRLSVGGVAFVVTFAQNASASAFKKMLPMTVTMGEMNGNEKYYYLPESLPTSVSREGVVRNGDVMLFGSSGLVLFYKTFSTSYSYTKLGTVDDPSGFEEALGGGSVTVKFELEPF